MISFSPVNISRKVRKITGGEGWAASVARIFSLAFEYNTNNETSEVGYETIDRIMAANGVCGDVAAWHRAAFFVRLAGGCRVGRALFGRKRVNMGAHEAFILADAGLCRGTEAVLS